MAWKTGEQASSDAPGRQDATVFRRLLRRVILYGLAYMMVTGALMVGLTLLLTWRAFLAIDAFREIHGAGAMPTIADFAKAHPELLLLSAGIAVLGIAVGWFGVWVVGRALGPERRPPRSVVLAQLLLLAPLGLGLMASASMRMLVLALAGGPVLYLFGWLLPIELTMLAAFQLSLAYRMARERQVFVDANELPKSAVAYFDQVEPDMRAAGLDPIGYIRYEGAPRKCRRLWGNPNRTFFASACWFPAGSSVVKAVSVYAVTEDGSYLEAANVPNSQFVAPEGQEHLFKIDPTATPAEVLNQFSEMFRSWIEQSGNMPMQIGDDEHEQLCDYGRARLSLGRQQSTQRNYVHDLLWLTDIWKNQPPPPLPGRRWEPETELAASGVEAF